MHQGGWSAAASLLIMCREGSQWTGRVRVDWDEEDTLDGVMESEKVGTWKTSSGGKRKLHVKGEDCSGLPGCALHPQLGEQDTSQPSVEAVPVCVPEDVKGHSALWPEESWKLSPPYRGGRTAAAKRPGRGEGRGGARAEVCYTGVGRVSGHRPGCRRDCWRTPSLASRGPPHRHKQGIGCPRCKLPTFHTSVGLTSLTNV